VSATDLILDLDAPTVIVSCDTHIGPRLVEDLRAYCPAALLTEFDDFAAETEARTAALHARVGGRKTTAFTRNHQTSGHFDMAQRLRDLDHDGVAAEVIFHGSQNEQPVPFGSQVAFLGSDTDDLTLVAAGRQIYNRWLADAVSLEPERQVGLAQLPLWDVEAAVRELEWASGAGLRGVNFPAPRPDLPPFNDRAWEPFWSAAAALKMPLCTHSGAGDASQWTGREAVALVSIESGGWYSRRGLHQMIFGGVFQRHPGLRLVLTEQPGEWWAYTLRELDSVWMTQSHGFRDQVPRPPSEYANENVFIGASFIAPFEAADAVGMGYVDRVMWGSDYPHMEGTYQFVDDPDTPSISVASMQHSFAGLDPVDVTAMVGATAIDVYGLDRDRLAAVARRIGAPSLRTLTTPLERVPEPAGLLAFRTFGPWA
jgi:predicted TIM-barrel fold metal-dependent hydrolase